MLNPRDSKNGWTLLLAGALALGATACGSSDDTDAGSGDAGADAGQVQVDATVVDSGPAPDAGMPPRPDAGHYCTTGGEVDVNGTAVPVADVSAEAQSSTGSGAVTTCIDGPPSDSPPFISEFCFTECVNFHGPTPSAAEVANLQVTVFEQVKDGNAVDPSYDYTTGADRQPGANTGAGHSWKENSADCDSGWQLEIGYNSIGETLNSETDYVVRVRTATTSAGTWPTMYMYNFIRRNDQSPANNCGNDETRIPSLAFEFPIIPANMIANAVSAVGATVNGSEDLGDGLGKGYAIIEARDCAGGGGQTMSGVSAGFAPAPQGAYYLGDDYTVQTGEAATLTTGLFIGVGFGANTATSSSAMNVAAAIGLTTDGTCTEEFGGLEIPVFADGVTFLRMNRETVLHGR